MSLKKKHIIFFSILLCFSFFLLYMNCAQPGLKVNQITISTSCNTSQKISEEEMFSLIKKNHTISADNPWPRCPGFFAVLEDDEKVLGAKRYQKLMADTSNNCGQEEPTPTPLPTATPPSTLDKEALTKELLAKVNPQNIKASIQLLSDPDLWPTRYHKSDYKTVVPETIKAEFKKIIDKANRSDILLKIFTHTNTPMPSVEVIIPGQGTLKDQFIVIGGHEDSINQALSKNNFNASAPGADDNASGIATMLEIFRVLVESNAKNNASFAFYAYSAEEAGLIGSQEVARSYSASKKKSWVLCNWI